MSKKEEEMRERIATAAMQGMLAASDDWQPQKMARLSVQYADALMNQLEFTKRDYKCPSA